MMPSRMKPTADHPPRRRIRHCQFVLLFVLVVAGAQTSSIADRVVPSERVRAHVNIHRLASSQSQVVGTLRVGESVEFVRSVSRWHEVRLDNGESGFVSKSWTRVVRDLAARQQDELRIHFLNVGAGTCTVVECPGANNPPPMIVDCGALGGTRHDMDVDSTRTYIQDILGRHSTAPNLALSHADRDHYGWIATVLRDTQIQNIWQGGDASDYTADEFPIWLENQIDNDARVHRDFSAHFYNDEDPIGADLSCGDASVFVLTVNTGSSRNAQSLVLEIRYEDFGATLAGDAEGRTERQARDNFDGNVKTTVLSGSHHGARTHSSNSVSWAAATSPEVVVFSAGRRFGHPQCDTVNRYTASLADTLAHPTQCGEGTTYQPVQDSTRAVYMTEVNGRIVVTSDGQSPLSLFCTRSAGCPTQIPH